MDRDNICPVKYAVLISNFFIIIIINIILILNFLQNNKFSYIFSFIDVIGLLLPSMPSI